jgi:hypothetical protein
VGLEKEAHVDMSPVNKSLILILLLLLAYTSWYWVQQRETAQNKGPLLKFSMESVDGIHITAKGKPEITLKREARRWQMTEPIRDFADKAKVLEFLGYAKGIEKERLISPSAHSLEPFGLDPPNALLAVQTPETSWELRFGNKTVDEEKVFACLGGSTQVFLVSIDALRNLPDQAFLFREKRLLRLEEDQVQDVEIEFGDNKTGFKKTARGWIQTDQGGYAGLLDQMERILEDLSRCLILNFDENGDQHTGQQGLTPPSLRVKVSRGFDGQTVLFGHQAREGFVYAKVEGRPGTMEVETPLLWKILMSR